MLFSLSRLSIKAVAPVVALVLASPAAHAQLVSKNDPSLPPAADGFNISEDAVTGLQWLDVTITAGRTFDDMVGNDGTNEFGPGGDFEGWRHATATELTGWTPSGQIDSLYKNFGFNSTFSSIGTYGPVRSFLSFLGCLGECSRYGYNYGIYVKDDDDMDPEWAEVEAFRSQGADFGSLGIAGTNAFLPHPSNNLGGPIAGHYIVRAIPSVSVPTMRGWAIAAVVGALLTLGCVLSRRARSSRRGFSTPS
jgi:hypothetical protein